MTLCSSELLSRSDTVLSTSLMFLLLNPFPRPFMPSKSLPTMTFMLSSISISKTLSNFSPSHKFLFPSPGSAPNSILQNLQRSTSASYSSPSKRSSRQPSASSNTTPGPSSPLPKDRSWAACTSLTSFLVSQDSFVLEKLERGNVGG